jgi:hypothetical protein
VKESVFDEILLLEDVRDGAAKRFGLPKGERPEIHQMVLHLAELHGIPTFRVSSRFPVGLARKLREAGMTAATEKMFKLDSEEWAMLGRPKRK